jgi:hypothetical protein
LKIYARLENNVVQEIIKPLLYDDGTDIPIELRFIPEFVATLVDITNEQPMPDERWVYLDGEFTEGTP